MTSISDPRGVDGLDGARSHLPPDRAHPVEPARGRALRARHDRRRLPLAAHHHLRGALQPDEAQPRRRARPRPHHPGRPARPRLARSSSLPAGARRADPDDGSHLRAPRRTRSSSRRPSATRRAASSASTSPARGPRRGRFPYARSRRSCSPRATPASA